MFFISIVVLRLILFVYDASHLIRLVLHTVLSIFRAVNERVELVQVRAHFFVDVDIFVLLRRGVLFRAYRGRILRSARHLGLVLRVIVALRRMRGRRRLRTTALDFQEGSQTSANRLRNLEVKGIC